MFESIVLIIGQIGVIGLASYVASMLVSNLAGRENNIQGFLKRFFWVVFYIIVGFCSVYWLVSII